ncbi:adenosine deaminase-like protein [Branchiostoma lanceolatum]|uniref:adenosine deaminase-like protein n=1 Tax=Branchiostoma lanceolatum TaxID=7740 RepID=UPI0034530334
MYEAEGLAEFCRRLPKVELHAHLSGSVTETTIQKLQVKKGVAPDHAHQGDTSIGKGETRQLQEPFRIFKIIQELSDTEEAIFMMTEDVITEFAADSVRYLELRSTPRHVPHTGMTPSSYVESILSAIQACKDREDVVVRLLLAIDRRQSVETAMNTVRLAQECALRSHGVVVGIDLSGNPAVGDGRDFIPVLKEAQNCGLKLALHIAEISQQASAPETAALLSLPPDRVGHGTFIHHNPDLAAMVAEKNTPFELCLTSNVKAQTVASYGEHHFQHWYSRKHPCVLCTDDKGVFCTTLSEEYRLAAETFGLTRPDLWDLSYSSIAHTFAGEDLKQQLRLRWNSEKDTLFKTR